jgi:phosphoribosyl 1,2-cyclic phosphodiesterase
MYCLHLTILVWFSRGGITKVSESRKRCAGEFSGHFVVNLWRIPAGCTLGISKGDNRISYFPYL